MKKTEKLYEQIKDYDWEYGIARFVKQKEFRIRSNMNEKLGDTFVGYVINRDHRDDLSLKYTCPVKTMKRFENGRIKQVVLDYESGEWTLVPRVKGRL